MGYTKSGVAALGSRGLGKAAFLYFSKPPVLNTDQRIIFYDTLLDDDEYRLGARIARNVNDHRLDPPYYSNEARQIIKTSYPLTDGIEFPLQLQPLEEVGTRVIIPYVDQEAIQAIRTGELHKWL
jgi:hypothetical protein